MEQADRSSTMSSSSPSRGMPPSAPSDAPTASRSAAPSGSFGGGAGMDQLRGSSARVAAAISAMVPGSGLEATTEEESAESSGADSSSSGQGIDLYDSSCGSEEGDGGGASRHVKGRSGAKRNSRHQKSYAELSASDDADDTLEDVF